MAFRRVQAWLLEKPAAWVGEDAPSLAAALMVQRPPGDALRKRPCEDALLEAERSHHAPEASRRIPRGGDEQRNCALRGTGAQQQTSPLAAGATGEVVQRYDEQRNRRNAAWRIISSFCERERRGEMALRA